MMTSHSLLHSSSAGLSPRWQKKKTTRGSQWRKNLPNKIPLDLKTALGDPRIAHVLLVATFSSQGHVGNSMLFPWLEVVSGIVLWDTQRSKCRPGSLGLSTGTYVTELVDDLWHCTFFIKWVIFSWGFGGHLWVDSVPTTVLHFTPHREVKWSIILSAAVWELSKLTLSST